VARQVLRDEATVSRLRFVPWVHGIRASVSLARWRLASLVNRLRRQAQGLTPRVLQVPVRLASAPGSGRPRHRRQKARCGGSWRGFGRRCRRGSSMLPRPASRSEGDRGPRCGRAKPPNAKVVLTPQPTGHSRARMGFARHAFGPASKPGRRIRPPAAGTIPDGQRGGGRDRNRG